MIHALTRAFAEATSVVLTGPLDLDGDAVGSMLALDKALSIRWPNLPVRLLADERVPSRYHFLPGAKTRFEVASDVEVDTKAFALVLDGDPDRLGSATPHFRGAARRGQIDHHKTSDPLAVDVPFIDPAAASTTELVLSLCDHWGVPLDLDLATNIYAGLVFDTHIFRYRLTRPPTLRAAARLMETGIDHAMIVERVLLDQPLHKVRLRARILEGLKIELGGRLAWAKLTTAEMRGAETGGLVDDLVFIEGVEVGVLLMEKGAHRVKLSLRSRGGVDCALVAQSLNEQGGGHARAAGASVEGSIDEVLARVLSAVRSRLPQPGLTTQ